MKRLILAMLLVLACVFAPAAMADDHSTLRVVIVHTDDVGAYTAALQEGKKILMAMDDKFTMRAYRATFAGERTGSVVVALEYPGGLSDFAAAWDKALQSDDLSAWLAGLSGLRTIVSDSIYDELLLD